MLQRTGSLWMMITVVILSVWWRMVEGAPGIVSSGFEGSGSGDMWKRHGQLASCEDCLKKVHYGLWLNLDCSHADGLAACIEGCNPSKRDAKDPLDTQYLEHFVWLFGILSRLRFANCELEDVAPGCTQQIVSCALDHIAASTSFQPHTLGSVECSDEALTGMYSCFEDQQDCVWRSNIETITSKARRSVCLMEDRCLINGNFYLIYSGCTSFKVVDVYDIDKIAAQVTRYAPPGESFDTSKCGKLQCTSPDDYESPDTFDASFVNGILVG